MKKVLFATTALVASAGIASAQGVDITGSAEMGIVGGDRYPNSDPQFLSSVDVRFAMSGETDNGLTFGATVDIDDVADMGIAGYDPVDNTDGEMADYNVFISGAFGTLTMGDTDGALDWAMTETAIGGSIDDSHTWHNGYNGNAGLDGTYDGQVARYNYSFGDFGFAASVEMDDTGVGDPVFGIGATYATSFSGVDLGFGLGYQDNGTASLIGASVDVAFGGGFQAILNYTEADSYAAWESHAGIGLGYTTGAITVGANYGVYDLGGGDEDRGFGLAANYDLGGGAEVQFGYGYGENETGGVTTDADSYSLGISMSF